MTTEQIKDILTQVDWPRFCKLADSIGPELNDKQLRFLKAIFLETAVASYSHSKLVYVGDSMNGCDFLVPELDNAKIEMKYTTDALYTAKGNTLRPVCQQITLLNSKGTNTHTNLPDTYADYLLIVGRRGAALIDKETLKKYVTSNGDSLSCCIPTSELIQIFAPSDLPVIEPKPLHIKKRLLAFIQEIIEDI